MKKLTHIKLFEQFSADDAWAWVHSDDYQKNMDALNKRNVILGFFADGGRGSHPGVIDSSMQPLINDHPEGEWLAFIPVEGLDQVPEAILAVHSDDENAPGVDGWYIKGISNILANEIINLGGSDVYSNENMGHPNVNAYTPLSKKAFELAGYKYDDSGWNIQILTVIPNVKINTVYWSDNPERSHGYWEPPYKAMPLKELLDTYLD